MLILKSGKRFLISLKISKEARRRIIPSGLISLLKKLLQRVATGQKIRETLENTGQIKKAGDGNRTHVSSLEGWCSTIELHLHDRYFFRSINRGDRI